MQLKLVRLGHVPEVCTMRYRDRVWLLASCCLNIPEGSLGD